MPRPRPTASRPVPSPTKDAENGHRAGYVAIVGRPNVGKSTLLNSLVGQKLSITSSRPQTTRYRITGVLTRPDTQVVLVDAPGFQTRHSNALNRAMNDVTTQNLRETDAVLLVVKALRFDERDREVVRMLSRAQPVFLVINKVDRVRDKALLLPFIEKCAREYPFAGIVPVSAAHGANLNELLLALTPHLPRQPALFEEDQITDCSARLLAGELVREKIFRTLGEELPYGAAVMIDRFDEDDRLVRVSATVIVEKPNHKVMVIGKGGAKLKSIATGARKDMERLFGKKVFVEIWVKVQRGWADSERMVKDLGYA